MRKRSGERKERRDLFLFQLKKKFSLLSLLFSHTHTHARTHTSNSLEITRKRRRSIGKLRKIELTSVFGLPSHTRVCVCVRTSVSMYPVNPSVCAPASPRVSL